MYREIHADVTVYMFAHLHTTLRTEENLFGIYWLQAAKELLKFNTWLKFKLFGYNIQRDIVFQKLQNFWAAKALMS